MHSATRRQELKQLNGDERGQIAFSIMLTFFIFFMICAIGLDVGLWMFDHRTAQNQADFASHAAALKLPLSTSSVPSAAINEAHASLGHNGAAQVSVCPASYSIGGQVGTLHSGMMFWDLPGGPSGQYDTVRVCVRRESPIIFSSLANVTGAQVSAATTTTLIEIILPSPYAIFADDPCTGVAGNTQSSPELEISGQIMNVTGRVHSNCDFKLSTDPNNFDGPVTFTENPPPTQCESGNTYVPASPPNDDLCDDGHIQNTSGQLRPILWDTWATISPDCDYMIPDGGDIAVVIPPTGNTLQPGVYCSSSSSNTSVIKLSGQDYVGNVTIASRGKIDISGSNFELDAFWTDPGGFPILLFTTSTDPAAIKASGSGGKWEGVIYAPFGTVDVSGGSLAGERLQLFSSIVGDKVKISGSSFDIEAIIGGAGESQFDLALIE